MGLAVGIGALGRRHPPQRVLHLRLRQLARGHGLFEAVERLAGSGALTGLGARFAEGMRESVEPWLAVPLPAAAERDAERARRERDERSHLRSVEA